MSKILEFIKSPIIHKNLLVALLFFFLLFNIIFLWMRIYTKHNKAIPTPDLYGYTLNEVDSILNKQNLEYVINDSVFQPKMKKNSVVSQHPQPGFKVKKGRKIFLVITSSNPEFVHMPLVEGVSLRQAKSVLETYGLYVGKITYVPDMAVNNVLKQRFKGRNISKDEPVIKGSSIDLVLGNGYSNQSSECPSLKALNLREAKNKLTNSFLNIGSVIYDNSVKNYKDSLDAMIYKQIPDEGRSISLGASIDIWLTVDSTKWK